MWNWSSCRLTMARLASLEGIARIACSGTVAMTMVTSAGASDVGIRNASYSPISPKTSPSTPPRLDTLLRPNLHGPVKRYAQAASICYSCDFALETCQINDAFNEKEAECI
jgi:hypothetical protein